MTFRVNGNAKLDVEDGFLILRKAFQVDKVDHDIYVSDGDNFFQKTDLENLDVKFKEKIIHVFVDCVNAAAQQQKGKYEIESSRFTYEKAGSSHGNSCFTSLARAGMYFIPIGHQKPSSYPTATINEQMSDFAYHLSAQKNTYVMKKEDFETPKETVKNPKDAAGAVGDSGGKDPKADPAKKASPVATKKNPVKSSEKPVLAKPNYPQAFERAAQEAVDREAALERRRRVEALKEKRYFDKFKKLLPGFNPKKAIAACHDLSTRLT